MRFPLAVAPLAALLLLGGCQAYPTLPASAGMAPAPTRAVGLQLVDLGKGIGKATVWLPRITTPKTRYEAVPSEWTAADVYEYRLALQVKVEGTFVAVDPPITLTLAQQGPEIGTGAQFGGLAAGEVYRIALETWGCLGGTSPLYRLDANNPAFSDPIDFTGENDIEQEVPVSIQPVLDAAPI